MKFSIIIPVYNVEKYLRQCIDSVLVQDSEDYEIILVDDGSPDNSGAICDEYASKYSQIKVIHKENGGLSDARNFGIKEAKGDYLMFLDSDDFWKGTSILSDLSKIIDNQSIDVILYGRTLVFENGEYIENPKKDRLHSNDFISNFEVLAKTGTYDATGWNKAVRRKLVIENNIEFPKGLLHEDVSWSFDIAQYIKNYAIYENPFYQYRFGREGAITQAIKDKNIISYIDICSAKTKYLLAHQDDVRFKGNKEYLGLIYLCVFRDFYGGKMTEEHKENAIKHFYKMQSIDNIYKEWFVNYVNGRKFKYLIKLFGIQRGMKLIYLYFKYIEKKDLRI